MAKPTITKRVTKNSPLTYNELDSNFQNIVDATISLTGDTGGTAVTADLNGNITLVAGSNITVTGDNTAKTITIDSTASGSLTNVEDDTSPTLGGDLDLNGYSLTNSTGNLNVGDDVVFPAGSGPIGTGSDGLKLRQKPTLPKSTVDLKEAELELAYGSIIPTSTVTMDATGITLYAGSGDQIYLNGEIKVSDNNSKPTSLDSYFADDYITDDYFETGTLPTQIPNWLQIYIGSTAHYIPLYT